MGTGLHRGAWLGHHFPQRESRGWGCSWRQMLPSHTKSIDDVEFTPSRHRDEMTCCYSQHLTARWPELHSLFGRWSKWMIQSVGTEAACTDTNVYSHYFAKSNNGLDHSELLVYSVSLINEDFSKPHGPAPIAEWLSPTLIRLSLVKQNDDLPSSGSDTVITQICASAVMHGHPRVDDGSTINSRTRTHIIERHWFGAIFTNHIAQYLSGRAHLSL